MLFGVALLIILTQILNLLKVKNKIVTLKTIFAFLLKIANSFFGFEGKSFFANIEFGEIKFLNFFL